MLLFVPCVGFKSCAPENEVRAYLADKRFMLFGLTSFIKMDEVLPIDETLNQTLNQLLLLKLDID